MGTVLFVLFASLIAATLFYAYLLSIWWAYDDARRRGQPEIFAALLVALVFWPLGLILWRLIRPKRLAALPPRPKRSLRVSLATMFIFTTIIAFAVNLYANNQTFEVICMLRLHRVPGQVIPHEVNKQQVVADLRSETLWRSAVEAQFGAATPRLTARILDGLEVNTANKSEVIMLVVTGRRYRDDINAYQTIMNRVVNDYMTQVQPFPLQLIQLTTVVKQ
ncbi:MAG: hypothetical protein KDA92_04110 [Planctomycetales bacterium]|nr:hypothetical protein [Planctomycetales bacterium]MCA9166482.1 hypothetical protein [Planctomycetales bacterium]